MEGMSKQKRRRSAAGSRWRNPNQRLSYTTELLHALRRVRRSSSPSSSLAVRAAADRILAAAAGGRSRWSAAILTGDLRRRRRSGRRVFKSSNKFTDLERKLRILGKLVPGCGRLPLSSLIKETSDYIAALEMQVQTMSALVHSLSSINQPVSL